MKKILVFICALIFSALKGNAQSQDILWQNSFYINANDEPSEAAGSDPMYVKHSVFDSADSSLILVGGRQTTSEFSYLVIQKIDKSGNTIAFNTIKGDAGNCWGNRIVSDGETGYWIAGVTSAVGGDVIGENGDLDIWFVHIDENLNMIDQIRFEDEFIQGLEMQFIRTADSGYLLAHTFKRDSIQCSPFLDVQVIKFDSQFNVEWEIEKGDHFLVDEKDEDLIKDVIQLADSGYLFVGMTNSDDSIVENNVERIWTFKLGFDGSTEWEKIYEGLGQGVGYKASILPNDNVVLSGYSNCFNCDPQSEVGGVVLEIDSLGNLIRSQLYGGSYPDAFYQLQILPNGHLLLAGFTSSDDGDLISTVSKGGPFDIWVLELFDNWEIYRQWRLGGDQYDYPINMHTLDNDSYILINTTNSNSTWYGDVLNNPNENCIFWTIKIGKRVEDAMGVEEQKLNLVLYPNPTSDVVHVKVPFSLMGAKYNVYNANGQRIMSSVFTSTDSLIDLSNLSSGTYTVSVPQWGWSKSILKEK